MQVKGEIMAVDFCLLVGLLLVNPVSQRIVGQPDGLDVKFDLGLVDINEVDTDVEVRWHTTLDPNASKFWSPLEKLIRTRLEASGIHIFHQPLDAKARAMREIIGRRVNVDPNTLRLRPAAIPVLRAAVDVVSLGQDGLVALYAHTSFARLVCLDGRRAPSFKATVWSADPVAKSVQSSRWQDEVQKVVLEQVDSFIAAQKAAASHDGEARKALSTPALPRTTASASQYPFVASKSGSVFHRPDCRWAQNISDDKRLGYNTREEAEQAGKRPCKSCKP
jgi:hypothetical protein